MIYADYNGSAPLLPAVKEYLHARLDSDLFANPNAIHSKGQKVSQGIEKCRSIVSGFVGCQPNQLFFNSGSSEGVSHILFSVLEWAPVDKNVIITTSIEHAVIPSALDFYKERRGFKIYKVNVDPDGAIDLDHFKELMQTHSGKVAMVTIMAVNNETGVFLPYKEIAAICSQEKVEYFCDTTQLIGKGEFNFADSGVDYAVCSGHKIGALTGSGFVIAKDPTKLKSHVFGSIQEKGLRGGTQHYLGIETLAVALDDFNKNKHKLETLASARERFEKEIKAVFPEAIIMGEKSKRLAGTTLIGYPGIHGQAVQIELETHDIFVTTSAACSDNQPETSKVLKAMGVGDDVGRSVVRISLSHSHGDKEYSTLVHALKTSYNKLKKIHSY